VKLFQECPKVRREVVVLESCDVDNLIRNEIQFQLFHRYNLVGWLDSFHKEGRLELIKIAMLDVG
jgi:hypothetical protein